MLLFKLMGVFVRDHSYLNKLIHEYTSATTTIHSVHSPSSFDSTHALMEGPGCRGELWTWVLTPYLLTIDSESLESFFKKIATQWQIINLSMSCKRGNSLWDFSLLFHMATMYVFPLSLCMFLRIWTWIDDHFQMRLFSHA